MTPPSDHAPDELEDAVNMMIALASGDLEARCEVPPEDNAINALMHGLNMVAEELQARTVSMEQYAAVNARLLAREAQLSQALEEKEGFLLQKEVLLREMHHRVRNNLQLLSSLSSLQRRFCGTEEGRAMLATFERRLHALSMLHNQVRFGTHGGVELGAYLHRLVHTLIAALSSRHIRIEAPERLELAVVAIDRAVPLALILNELITNAIEHAYPDGGSGCVSVTAEVHDGVVTLRVADDGRGFDRGSCQQGLGLTLVDELAAQLDAEIAIERQPKGTIASVRVALPPAP
jgi:two-component sensor histidine kinase